MRELKYKVGGLSSVIIPLGIQGENGATTIRIDYSEWLPEGVEGYPTISVMTPNGTQYPASTNREDEISEDGSHSVVVWPVTSTDTVEFGDGLITVSVYTENEVLIKSTIARTSTAPSFLKYNGEAPGQYEYWLEELEEKAARTASGSIAAANAARQAALASANSQAAYEAAKALITLLEAADDPGAYLDKAMALSSTMPFNVAANEWELVDGLYTVSRENLVALDETVAVFLPDESAVNMADGIRAGCEEGTVYLTTPVVPTGDITGTVILLGHMSIEPSIVPASTSATRAAASATEAAGYAAVAASSMATAGTSATAAQTAQAAAEAAAAGISADISGLQSAIQQKITEPSTDGTSGQVLTTDGNGGRSWTTVEGGGGGTSDYSDLTNKPSINSVTLSGNKSLSDLGIASTSDVSAKYTKPVGGIPASDIASGVIPDVSGKLDAPSTEGTSGQVLTTDGNGGRSWTTVQGGGGSVTVDTELSTTSTNPVQNRIITSAISNQAEEDTAPLGEELVTSTGWTLGTGWSGNLSDGFVHSSGTATLAFTMPESTQGNFYQVSFKSTVAMTEDNLFVSVGNSPNFNLYYEEHSDGTISVGVLAASDGNLVFTPATGYTGTITNVSVKQVTDTYPALKQYLDSDGNVSLELRVSPDDLSNLFVGLNAGQSNTTGRRNVALGSNALRNNLSGWRNIAIGANALIENTAGTRNVAIGENSMISVQSGQRNIAIGSSTMEQIVNGNRNIAIGADAMFNATDCNDSVGIGFGALSASSGDSNFGLGTNALQNASGGKNVGIGHSAGYGITTGTENVGIGAGSVYNLKTGKNNVGIGSYALKGASNSDQSNYNVAIGYCAAQNIGRYSGNNVVIGANAAATLSGADYCIVIGSGADVTASDNYQLNIGGLLKGSLDSSTAYLLINGGLALPSIPTSDPHVAGRVWSDSGTLKISAG